MVSATESTPPALKPRKQAATRRKDAWQLTPEIESQARTLYLVRSMAPQSIAEQLGVKRECIYDLVSKRGWAKLRSKTWANADAQVQAQLTEDVARVMQTIAVESEEMTFGGLQMLRESIKDRDAKSFSMASTGVRNLVEVSRRIRGLDQQQAQGSGGGLNFFVLTAAPQPMKIAQPGPSLSDSRPVIAIETSVSVIETAQPSQQATPAAQ